MLPFLFLPFLCLLLLLLLPLLLLLLLFLKADLLLPRSVGSTDGRTQLLQLVCLQIRAKTDSTLFEVGILDIKVIDVRS